MTEGIERIVRRILDDAGKKADVIMDEAAQKADRVKAEAELKAAGKEKRILEQAAKEAEEQKRRIVGVALLDARKELLAAKQELLDKAFRQSLEDLANLEEPSYFGILKEMLLAQVITGRETVILSARDRERIPADFWREINEELKRSGKNGELTLSEETRAIQGGFVLQAGGVEINCSFKSLLDMQRDEIEPAVAGLLFA
ncbi:MAG: hypothetical protein KGZ32_00680 [Dethiobacter sp.]|jgi:V/A-type H+-transporting ATPase subunit E|nr:hypothetical protein [Dethiobacter sp.]